MNLTSEDCLKNLNGLASWMSLISNNLPEDRNIPIVLVPGFLGFGHPLFGALNYWGGIKDIPSLLMKRGYTVIVTPIAPISSNWERACELYAQLTAKKFDRFNPGDNSIPNHYDVEVHYGTLPNADLAYQPEATTAMRRRAILFTESDGFDEWIWSDRNRVHFLCHSQGGNTVRYLISLMKRGALADHPGYFSHHDRDSWIISVTTLGTPHKGTTVIDVLKKFASGSEELLVKYLARVFATLSFQSPKERTYDLQLDHWGICREGTQSFSAMRERLESDSGPVWKWLRSNCNGLYDNSIEGVNHLHLNTEVASPNIYYFTLSFHCTIPFPTTWPPWTLQAISTFPIGLTEIIQTVLNSIPGLSFIMDRILEGLTQLSGWRILSSIVNIRDLVRWFTTEVGNRLLREMGYNVTLPLPGTYLPRKDVLPFLLPTVYAMGGQELSPTQKNILGPNEGDWFRNDGVVNTESMRGPTDLLVRKIGAFPKTRIGDARGLYWNFGVHDQMDHIDEVGVYVEETTARAMELMYFNLAAVISRLPH